MGTRQGTPIELNPETEARAVLVGIRHGREPQYQADESLRELEALAGTAGVAVRDRFTQQVYNPRPDTYIRPGKVEQIAERIRQGDIDLVVFDEELSPRQVRNLEKQLECRVVDRSEVILDIFADHAQTHQARVQVELAQLIYEAPRLRRMWTHLSRIDGGIGTRGPGEKQLETDRRLMQRRINELKGALAQIEQRKRREVAARTDRAYTVSLVGYTNAGKSSLLNALTGAEVPVGDQLFKTLETRTRRWRLGTGLEVLLSDTVGFIRKLPHHLVASFHATLEEAANAPLLLHVIDASHPEAELRLHAVNEVLVELELNKAETLAVFNKADRVQDKSELVRLQAQCEEHVIVSAHTGEGLDRLAGLIRENLLAKMVPFDLTLPYAEGSRLALLEQRGALIEREYQADGVRVCGYLWPQDAGLGGVPPVTGSDTN